MADIMSPAERHACMSKVKGKNTKIEVIVRKRLFSLGFRYRLYAKDLPGHPDIVLPKYKTVIFVNGCFWHGHMGCKRASIPTTNEVFWRDKINSNQERDSKNYEQLIALGWRVIVIWECELKKSLIDTTINRIVNQLRAQSSTK